MTQLSGKSDSEQPLRSSIRYFYAYRFCYDFIFAYAVYNALFNIKGLNVLQISFLLAWWCLTSIVLEVPTGALADHWSRRKLLMIAPLFKALCFVTWFIADGEFFLYALGFLCWSAGSTLVSGTFEASVYETLAHHGKTSDFERVQGRIKFYYYISLAVSMITGGFIAYYSLDLVLMVSVIPLFFCVFIALQFRDVPRQRVEIAKWYRHYFGTAWQEVKGKRLLRYLFIYQVFCHGIFGDMEEYDQLYYKMVGLPLFAFGLVGFAVSGLASLGSLVAHRLKDWKALEYLLPMVTGVMIVCVGAFPAIWMIAILVITYFLISPMEVLVESRIQHTISAEHRATVTSMGKFFAETAGISLTLAFGAISRIWDLGSGYIFFGISLILFSLWVVLYTGYRSNTAPEKAILDGY